MPAQPGQTITASLLRRLQPTVYSATGTANTTLTSVDTVLAGNEITLTSETDGATFKCEAVYAFDINVDSTDYVQGNMYLNGVQEAGSVRWNAETSDDFGTCSQMWHGSLATAGSYTFDLRAFKVGSTGEIRTLGAFTKILVTIYEA